MPLYQFLKNVPLFANMSDEDLSQLCEMMNVVELEDGEQLFAEGDHGDKAYVIQKGELEILKVSGNRTVLLAVRGKGEVIGEMALLENRPRMASVRARGDTKLLAIHQEQLTHLLSTSRSAAEAMYYNVLARWRNTESRLRSSEKMAQLGSLTAGVAHELNNPAAAVRRGSQQLESVMVEREAVFLRLVEYEMSAEQKKTWQRLTEVAKERAQQPPEMDALARSDKEMEMEDWLDEQGVEDPWDLSPALVNLEFSQEDLELLADQFEPELLGPLIGWLGATYTTYSLFKELQQGAERISGIVKALKTYSYLDQAPIQEVDINQGINDTLLILSHKLKSGPSVRRELDPNLPIIQGYGSELNQVWTNMIDNAIDAVENKPPGEGIITIRTRPEGDDWVIIEIEDNGAGIPEDIQSRIFDPFFTTKPPGAGTGLGLDISYNIVVHKHRGDIKVFSEPGKTLFQVWLPLNFEESVIDDTSNDPGDEVPPRSRVSAGS